MLPDEIIDAVVERVSGIHAKEIVTKIAGFHRIQASPGIEAATRWVEEEISKTPGVKTQSFAYDADGKTEVATWQRPLGWSARSGVLELIEPEKRILADFSTEPISLIAHSQTADLEAEIVDVGKGSEDKDYEGKDLKGKIVLTESRARTVHDIACIEHNAEGLLTYVAPSGEDELARLRRYDAIWPRAETAEKSKFGFALTQADGLKIKQWLNDGKTVKVKASVDAELGGGKLEVLSALIEGNDTSKEFWFFAHICHPKPGANDNASGSGAVLEALRTVTRLISDGVLEKPNISIRFLWGPEWSSTIEFIQNEPEILGRCVAMLNLDMVGADPCKSGSKFHEYRTPFSLPTSFNNVVRHWAETEKERKPNRRIGGTRCPLNFYYDRYSAGSDHYMLTDATVGIPAVMLNQYPDRYYHTSTDVPDSIDPVQMAYVIRVAVLTAISYAYPAHFSEEELMTLCRNETVELMHEVLTKGVFELARCIGNPNEVYPRVLRWLGYAHDLGQETLDKLAEEWKLISVQESIRQSLKASLQMAYTSNLVVARKSYEGACAEVGLQAKDEEQITLEEQEFGLEVKRVNKHALSLSYVRNKLGKKVLKYYQQLTKDPKLLCRLDELRNLALDWEDLDTIWDKLCFQFGHQERKDLLQFVKDLEEAGDIETRSV